MSDERDDRPRTTKPAWAAVPTMPWKRVTPKAEDNGEPDEAGGRGARRAAPALPPGAGRAAVPQPRGQRPIAPPAVDPDAPPRAEPTGRRNARVPSPPASRGHGQQPHGPGQPDRTPPAPYPAPGPPPGPFPTPYPGVRYTPEQFSGPPYPPVPAHPHPGLPHPDGPYGAGPQSGPPYSPSGPPYSPSGPPYRPTGRQPLGPDGRPMRVPLPPFALTDPTPPGGIAAVLAAAAPPAPAATRYGDVSDDVRRDRRHPADPSPDDRDVPRRRRGGRRVVEDDVAPEHMSAAEALLDLGARVTERPEPADATTRGDADAPSINDATDWFTPKHPTQSSAELIDDGPADESLATDQPFRLIHDGVAAMLPASVSAPPRPDGSASTDDVDHILDAIATGEEAVAAAGADADTSYAEADDVAAAPSGPPDPEQLLARIVWRYDPETLHELVDDEDLLREIHDMLTAKVNDNSDNASRARLLSLRAVVSRILGDLHKALADAKLALAHADATGELRRIAICQARLANVLQWRGDYAEADRLLAQANSTELPDRLRGTMHSHAGRSAYDQGRYIEACKHFEAALELGKEEDPELVAATEVALDAVLRRVAVNGWGPYPRTREELLQVPRPPSPAMDEETGLWGFTDADGETVVEALYADIQPFRDGVAWVRRPESDAWELIGETGETLIKARYGYLGVSSFAGGLAWVSRDGKGRWIAIDRHNSVTISTGFDDVRPFRRGVAAVRRKGHWGAVDSVGRVIVPFAYDLFATALSDGRYIDGFSDEGLAIVEVDGRKGVVDRSGRTVVDPTFTSLVIHPVAFLITDDEGRWGALDRKGRILIDPTHPSRVSVTMEIDRLLADSRPVL